MSIARHHNEWLGLVEQSGPFLSVPVLMESDVFSTGLDPHDPDLFRSLRIAYDEWRDQPHDLYGAWIEFILRDVLGYTDSVLLSGQTLPPHARARIAEHGESIVPDYALVNPDSDPHKGKLRLLIRTVPVGQDLDKPLRGMTWKASPNTRMVELLHATDTRLGLVTNGEDWTLVHAPRGETSGFATWKADLWCEESITLRAFRSLLTFKRFFGVADENTIEKLYERSALNQQEVTDQLGLQVRHAVEILVSRLDRLDQDNGRDLLRHVEEKRVYESALTIMMRLVFLMCAEERGLFPMDEPIYAQHYAVTTLRDALDDVATKHGEEILERRHDAWVRLLALFRLIYGGSNDDRLRIVAYGGGLFDPDRFSFLEGRLPGTTWRDTSAHPLPVDNRTVLHLLKALQVLQINGEARRLSFRALDIEQIGHVYEGLLDHTAIRALPGRPVLGLQGTARKEPEVELATLEKLRGESDEKLIAFLTEESGRSDGALWNSSTKPKSTKKRGRTKAAAAADDLFNADDSTDGEQPIAWPIADHAAVGKLLAACNGDQALYRRILPFAGLIRTDTFGNPVIIPGGAIYVTQGTDRRSTGTHYTPRSLTEPIVQYTLEPLVYLGPAEGLAKEDWKLRSPRELLDLKICDMAMGSGAFLVQACRYMSERLVESWEQEEARTGQRLTFPEADPATGKLTERPLPADTDERLALSRRAVAERCLYGVDKNPLAVEIAKLSLWLITLDKGRPFTFVDHALKAGDSLLGLHDPRQLENFHLDPKQGELLNHDFVNKLAGNVVRRAMTQAADLRRQLEGFVVNSPRDAARKHELLREAEAATDILRTLADLIVGAQLQIFRKEFDCNYDDLIQKWMQEDVYFALDEGFDHETRAKHRANLERHARQALANRDTFHWALEFPEVGGFQSFLGNPPFLWGMRISSTYGDDYLKWLEHLTGRSLGAADFCVHFLNRAAKVVASDGAIGLVLVDTVTQGDTRECGLDIHLASGFTIYRATSSMPWPGSAGVKISTVHITQKAWSGFCLLDGEESHLIDSRLTFQEQIREPQRLKANESLCFVGHYLMGQGFVLSPEEREQLLSTEPKAQDVVFPYLRGEDINQSLNQRTESSVINFDTLPLGVCRERYPATLARVEALVKPERDSQKRKRNREFWWQYAEVRPGLSKVLKRRENVIVQPFTSKYITMTLVPSRMVFASPLVVFDLEDYGHLSVLCSSLHDIWVRRYSSQMGDRIRYSSSDGLQTFPLPQLTRQLEQTGEEFLEQRDLVREKEALPLTDVLNRFHNPKETSDDIQTLRDLHVEMDRAVLDAYRQSPGEAHIWTGFGPDNLEHGFHETKQGLRFTVSERARRELLDRLLELNHKRYAEEVAAGLHDKKKAKGRDAGSGKRGAKGAGRASGVGGRDAASDGGFLDDDLNPVVESGEVVATPPKDRHQALMALLLHLVKHRPGLAEDQYADALGDAVRIQKHSGVLTDDQQDQLAEALPQIPALVFKAKPKVKFKDLWNSLQQLGYLRIRLEGATRHFEPRDHELNKDHGWLVWPVEGFAELVFAVGDAVDRDEDQAGDLVGRDLEEVEV